MRMRANYPGRCSACAGAIKPGDLIDWDKETRKTCHASCPPAAKSAPASAPKKSAPPEVLLASAPPRPTAKANKRADHCHYCGSWTRAGEGRLLFCVEDSGCMEHFDRSGYHVICSDPAECKKREVENRAAAKRELEERRAQQKAERAAEERAEAEGRAAFEAARAGLVATICTPPVALGKGEVIARWKDTTVTRYATERGPVVTLDWRGYDDSRSTFYVAADLADDAVRAWALREKITRADAEEFLAKYEQCSGADEYRRFLALENEKGSSR